MNKQSKVYVLELEDGKYYIGASVDPEKRFLCHVSGEGAAWTRKHWPIRILQIIEGGSNFEEDKVTKEYMAKYGIDNVRGGSHVQLTIPPEERKCLKKEIWMANKLCMRCGRSSHRISYCYATRDACGDLIEDAEAIHVQPRNEDHTLHSSRYRSQQHYRDTYYSHYQRCGSSNHYIRDSFARKWTRTYRYEDSIENIRPVDETDYKRDKGRTERVPESCRRCHQTGHNASECYTLRPPMPAAESWPLLTLCFIVFLCICVAACFQNK